MLEFGHTTRLLASAFYVRLEVFVKEQGITLEDEFDEKFNTATAEKMIPESGRSPSVTSPTAFSYFVEFRDDLPVATLRYELTDDWLHPDRLCVLPAFRRQYIGTSMLLAAESRAQRAGVTRAFLHGELAAQTFYEELGYQAVGTPFVEDGLPCQRFEKNLTS